MWSGYVAALLPVLYLAHRIHQAPLMPFQDYWTTLARITNPDGSIHLRGFLSYQNEHPFVVPNVLYYLDARFLQGTNTALGYYALAIGVLSVAILRSFIPPTWSPAARAWMTAAISVLLLSPSGLWNFVRGMSGAAWLTANLFGLLAVLLAVRARPWLALAAAALAIASYGTGFAAPVAIIVVIVASRQRARYWICAAALLAAALAVYARTANGGTTGTGASHDVVLVSRTFLTNLGMLWDPDAGSVAVISGAVGLAVLVLSFVSAWSRGTATELLAWWGVGAYAVAASGLISVGRGEVFGGDGSQGRYASLSALFWVTVLMVIVHSVLAHQRVMVRGAVVAVTALCIVASSNALAQRAVSEHGAQRVLAAAVRIGHANAFPARMFMAQQQIPRLKALGDYPFVDSYDFGCGHKPGDVIDVSKVRSLPVPKGANLGAIDSDALTVDSRRWVGWVRRAGKPLQCVLVVDARGTVIGGGAVSLSRPDINATVPGLAGALGFEAVGPADVAGARLILGFDDGFFQLAPR
ncbi:MAG: hypothetical protein ABJA87_09260 [bacterium]